MLHRINVPSCRPHLEWIVQLQRLLLVGLTEPAMTLSDVTVEWAMGRWPGLETRWIRNFCNRKDEIKGVGQPMLAHMQAVAAFPASLKQELLAAFDYDLLFPQAFEDPPQAHALRGLAFLPTGAMRNSVRGLLGTFYSPTFYSGYRIPQPEGGDIGFDNKAFVECFDSENERVQVCPYCDGSREGSQVDHFYPKSDYPSLSCHPLNLIPICGYCNSASNKGSTAPLTHASQAPTADWFHPYLRSADGIFDLQFESSPEGLAPAMFSADPQMQTRLDNLAKLLNLRRRWRSALQRCIGAAHKKIRHYVQETGRPLTREELVSRIQELVKNAEWEVGRLPFFLVEAHYLRQAATQTPAIFDELWDYNLGLP